MLDFRVRRPPPFGVFQLSGPPGSDYFFFRLLPAHALRAEPPTVATACCTNLPPTATPVQVSTAGCPFCDASFRPAHSRFRAASLDRGLSTNLRPAHTLFFFTRFSVFAGLTPLLSRWRHRQTALQSIVPSRAHNFQKPGCSHSA